jgi:hypothetical protein
MFDSASLWAGCEGTLACSFSRCRLNECPAPTPYSRRDAATSFPCKTVSGAQLAYVVASVQKPFITQAYESAGAAEF